MMPIRITDADISYFCPICSVVLDKATDGTVFDGIVFCRHCLMAWFKDSGEFAHYYNTAFCQCAESDSSGSRCIMGYRHTSPLHTTEDGKTWATPRPAPPDLNLEVACSVCGRYGLIRSGAEWRCSGCAVTWHYDGEQGEWDAPFAVVCPTSGCVLHLGHTVPHSKPPEKPLASAMGRKGRW